jgi:hypothetical protein
MAFGKSSLTEIVHELSKGDSEKKLNKYFRNHYSINTIKDSLLILVKSNTPVPINFNKLDSKLDELLTSDISFLLKLIEINPYYFVIASKVLKYDKKFVLRALDVAKDRKIIYQKLNHELKEDPHVLDLVFPKSKYHAIASRVNNNFTIPRARRQNPDSFNNVFATEAHFELVNSGKKLSPERSAKKSSLNRSAKKSSLNRSPKKSSAGRSAKKSSLNRSPKNL